MNKKKLKLLAVPIAVASASVIGMVSGTLAYFTSIDKATVSIEAGQVKVSYAVKDATFATSTTFTNFTGTTAFENGGTVAVGSTANSVTVSKMTPGDIVEFDVEVKNLSNVDIKYKLAATWNDKTIGTDPNGVETGKGLSEALVVSAVVKGTSTSILTDTYVNWDYSATAADMIKTMHVKVTFPVGDHDNAFQGAISDLSFGIDAIQQNALVYDANGFIGEATNEVGKDAMGNDITYTVHKVGDATSFNAIYNYEPAVGETPMFRLIDDLDFDGVTPTLDEDFAFTGTLDGNNHIISNYNLGATGKNYVGFFSKYTGNSVVVKDITFKNCDVVGEKGVGLIFGGSLYDALEENTTHLGTSLLLENITTDANCSVIAHVKSCGGFIGIPRCYEHITVKNCVNNMNIYSDQTNNGGFFGSGAYSKYIYFENCVNNGNITGGGETGGFGGQFHTATTIEFKNCENNGNIESGNKAGWFFSQYGGTVTFTGNLNTGVINYTSDDEPTIADKARVDGSQITVPTGNAADYIQPANTGVLNISVDSNNDFVVAEFPGAATYVINLKIVGIGGVVSGNTMTLTKKSNYNLRKEYSSVAALKAGFGRITRSGYFIDSSVTTFNSTVESSTPTIDDYVEKGRAQFFRMDETNSVNPTTYDEPIRLSNNEWAVVHECDTSALSNIIFDPMGANYEYYFTAYDSSSKKIAIGSYIDAVGSGTPVKNMSGMSFSAGVDYSSSMYYDYVA